MRFKPWKCSVCGESAQGTCDLVPGISLLNFDKRGNAEYASETKMYWDGQITETDDEGRVKMICINGHEWFAVQEGDD